MKTYTKLQSIMIDAKISIQDLHDRQKEMFRKEECFTYATLRRIVKGEVSPKMPALLKICQLLGISITEIIENTEFEDVFIIQPEGRFDSYSAQPNIPRDILSNPTSPFMFQEITLPQGEKTNVERSSAEPNINYTKFIYVVEGQLKLFINDQEYNIKRRGSVTFRSDLPHYYMNIYKNDCVLLVFLNPKHY